MKPVIKSVLSHFSPGQRKNHFPTSFLVLLFLRALKQAELHEIIWIRVWKIQRIKRYFSSREKEKQKERVLDCWGSSLCHGIGKGSFSVIRNVWAHSHTFWNITCFQHHSPAEDNFNSFPVLSSIIYSIFSLPLRCN